jgi:hypothetical protein
MGGVSCETFEGPRQVLEQRYERLENEGYRRPAELYDALARNSNDIVMLELRTVSASAVRELCGRRRLLADEQASTVFSRTNAPRRLRYPG